MAEWPGLDQSIAVLGKIVEVLRGRARGIAFESGEPVADVCGVADLARLAVADDVHADFRLMIHGGGDGAAHHLVELRLVNRFAAVLREQQIHHFLGARQAAYVRRQEFDRCSASSGPLRSAGISAVQKIPREDNTLQPQSGCIHSAAQCPSFNERFAQTSKHAFTFAERISRVSPLPSLLDRICGQDCRNRQQSRKVTSRIGCCLPQYFRKRRNI